MCKSSLSLFYLILLRLVDSFHDFDYLGNVIFRFFWVFPGKSSEKFCCTSLKLSCTVAWSS